MIRRPHIDAARCGIRLDSPPGPRARWQRWLACLLAATLWTGTLQLTWRDATQAAAQLAPAAMPALRFGLQQARAQAIADPGAPIRFQPAITHSTGPGGGVPVVNITAPNANGISLNQYRQFHVDPIGLILNNGLLPGGALLGGTVAANPNLLAAGVRAASLILNQVTRQGSPSRIAGTIEVFGQAAAVVIANPNGIACTGCGVVNTPHLTLTSGVPQFLNAPGGAASSFDTAAALAFAVQGGHLQIDGLPGNDGQPGAGIEGTVGAISLIGDTIGVNAALHAGQQVSLIAGRQWVSQATPGQGQAGGDYGIAPDPAGSANPSLPSPPASAGAASTPRLQIDATAFGAMTAGQITVVGTSAGLGVRTDGSLIASLGRLSIDANGNVQTGATYGKQGVAIQSAGSVRLAGEGVSEGGYAVNAAAGIALDGKLQAGGNLALQAGGDIVGGASVSGAADVLLRAGGGIAVGGVAADGDLALAAANGSVTTSGPVLTLGMLAIAAHGDASLGGPVHAGRAATLASQTGDVTVRGTVAAREALAITAAHHLKLEGAAQAGGDLTLSAGSGDVAIAGGLATSGRGQVTAGANLAISGDAGMTGDAVLVAGGDLAIGGRLASGAGLRAQAGADLRLGSVLAVGDAQLAGRTLAVGDTTIGGTLAASAAFALDFSAGALAVGGDTQLAGHTIALGDSWIGGNLDAVARHRLTSIGRGAVQGQAALAGAAVVNSGNWFAREGLTIRGDSVANQEGAHWLSLADATIDVTTLANAGTIAGNTVTLGASDSLANNQGIVLGRQALAIRTGALAGNRDGVLLAGDPAQAEADGKLTLTVTGGNGSFNNAGGVIAAARDVTLDLPNQAFDPLAAASGTLAQNGTLTVNARTIAVDETWHTGGTGLALAATDGVTVAAAGAITNAGSIRLATAGVLANRGTIDAGADVALTGTLDNQAGAVIHAGRDLSLDAAGVNRGQVEAGRDIAIGGGGYDNRQGNTQANRDLAIGIGGRLDNGGGILAAGRDLKIAAATVNNDRTAPVASAPERALVRNDALLGATVVGTATAFDPTLNCDADGCAGGMASQPATLALLAPGAAAGSMADAVTAVKAPERMGSPDEGGERYENAWHVSGQPASPGQGAPTLALPQVERIAQAQAHGQPGVILAGGALAITAATLSNRGGRIAAGGDAALRVGTLDNGLSAPLLASVQERVDQAGLDAFLTQLQGLGPVVLGAPGNTDCDTCPAPPPLTWLTPASVAVAPSRTARTVTSGLRGQISAGGNLALDGTADLLNAGDLAAAGTIRIATPGTFTNQGSYDTALATTPDCLPGAATCREDHAHNDSWRYRLDPNAIAAGGTLTVEAGAIRNDFGTLAARGDVTLAAASVANLAGGIQSTRGDVIITADQIVNRVAEPVALHQSYGNRNPPFAPGCNPGGTYKESHCAAEVAVPASPAAVISGARNVTLSGGTLVNRGGLIAGGADVTVDMAGTIDNASVALNADWRGRWVEETCWFCSDKRHGTYGTVATGSQESGIQAGNHLAVTSGGVLQNTGNLYGKQVDASGAALLNGYTDPHQPTPPATPPSQVIPLGPLALPAAAGQAQGAASQAGSQAGGGLPVAAPGVPSAPGAPEFPGRVAGQDGAAAPILAGTPIPRYVVGSAAGAVLGSVGPEMLLANLPASLQPATPLPFYYDPYTENQRLQQAALMETGRASVVSGLAYDNRFSPEDAQKALLYSNAIAYASANAIQLGQALSAQQVQALDRPLLWYVEQTVPNPSCTLASTACPAIAALMPQLYLPRANGMDKLTGGTIAGNEVSLDFSQSLLNTGSVVTDTLAVKSAALSNLQRSIDLGRATYRVDGGWIETSGTQLQPGGFMSALHLDLQVQAIESLGDAFQLRNADGGIDVAGTQALLEELQSRLGSSYMQEAAADTIQRRFIQQDSALGQVGTLAVAVGIGILTAGAGVAALGTTLSVQAGTLGGAVLNAAVSSVIGTTAVGAVNGNLRLENVLRGATTAALTAGLTNGLTYSEAGGFGTTGWSGNGVNNSNTLANLAGGQVVGTDLVKAAVGQGAGTLGSQLVALVGASTITAGVSTVIQGGSFRDAFIGSLVSHVAAAGAYAVGDSFAGIGTDQATVQTVTLNLLGHALVGCAAASLKGGDCASGAVGGATSALVAPLLRDGLYQGTQTVDSRDNGDGTQTVTTAYDNPAVNAAVAALAMLAGGGMAASLGHDRLVAANAAANEAVNNATATKTVTVEAPMPVPVPTPFGMVMMPVPVWGTAGLPGKPNQQGLDDDYLLTGMPDQTGLFHNSGTNLPAWVDDLGNIVRSLPNQIGQWANQVMSHSTLSAVSPLLYGAQVMMSVRNGEGAEATRVGVLEREATGFLGKSGFELKNAPWQKVRNEATEIGGREFSGHALELC